MVNASHPGGPSVVNPEHTSEGGHTVSVRVLLVDDHRLLRMSLESVLNDSAGLEIVGALDSGDELADTAARLHPDVVILDIDMPGRDVFQAARELTSNDPRTRVLFLTAFSSDADIDNALRCGARGYVVKDEPPETLVHAIRAIADDRLWFSDAVRERIELNEQGVHLRAREHGLFANLSPREMETLRYIARGMTKREIGALMGVSVKTVEKHTANVMSKVAVHDRVQLARLAIAEGIARP